MNAINDLVSQLNIFSNNSNEEAALRAKKVAQYMQQFNDGELTKDEVAELIDDLVKIDIVKKYGNELDITQKINKISNLLIKAIKK
jgi:cell shape-determining protein MreC